MPKIYVTECGKHTICRATAARVREFMVLTKEQHRDRATGEVNATTLAEAAAHQFDHEEWLDDETADVWDWAAAVAGPV